MEKEAKAELDFRKAECARLEHIIAELRRQYQSKCQEPGELKRALEITTKKLTEVEARCEGYRSQCDSSRHINNALSQQLRSM